jgi:hypothetical protein
MYNNIEHLDILDEESNRIGFMQYGAIFVDSGSGEEEDILSISGRISYDKGKEILEEVIKNPDLSVKNKLNYDEKQRLRKEQDELGLIQQEVRHREHFIGDDWLEEAMSFNEYYHKLKELGW